MSVYSYSIEIFDNNSAGSTFEQGEFTIDTAKDEPSDVLRWLISSRNNGFMAYKILSLDKNGGDK